MSKPKHNGYSLKWAVYEYGIKESGNEGWLLSAAFVLKIDAEMFRNESIRLERAEEDWIQVRLFGEKV